MHGIFYNQLSPFEVRSVNYLSMSQSSKQKCLSGDNLKSVCSENVLQIIIKAFVAQFIFCGIPCFQHILMNFFRQMFLNSELFFEMHLTLNIQAIFSKQPETKKAFWWKYSKSENQNSYLGNTEQKKKALLWVVPHSSAHFVCVLAHSDIEVNYVPEKLCLIKLNLSRSL